MAVKKKYPGARYTKKYAMDTQQMRNAVLVSEKKYVLKETVIQYLRRADLDRLLDEAQHECELDITSEEIQTVIDEVIEFIENPPFIPTNQYPS